ncbi:ferredoxin [Streptomyces rectiverticillatus]|uniref:ferredoxin n=1 Tax=Streptomyces rectiverticillatus TaxID=173860 RepID=UPI0015C357B8|nr:ferredoxin [Streptomyces rectiverticillatus]QLE70658.1 ferredoxin [Streptomyces rectiverticillatus]
MRVSVETPRCVGSGQCVMLTPDVFDQDDDGIVVLLQEAPPEEVHEDVRQAAMTCPTQVISVGE